MNELTVYLERLIRRLKKLLNEVTKIVFVQNGKTNNDLLTQHCMNLF